MDITEHENPLGIRVPIPQLQLRLDDAYLEHDDDIKGKLVVQAGMKEMVPILMDLNLIRTECKVKNGREKWSETGFWQINVPLANTIPAKGQDEFPFRFPLPSDAIPSHQEFKFRLGTRIEFFDGLELRADVEVCVLESLDITEEEDHSIKDSFGYTDKEHFKIIGEKPPLPHALEDYLERFDSMVNDLKESPMTVVLNYHQFPPVSTSEIEAAERLLGYALPAALKVFFQQTNGLQLRWIKTDNPQYDPLRDVPEESPLSWDWSASPLKGEDGIVMLQPLERLLDDGGLAEASVMQPKQPMYQLQYLDQTLSSVEFQSKLRIFDGFSRRQQAILLLSDTPDPCLHIGKLGQVHYGEGYLVDIGTYLEFLIARLALVERRNMFMPSQPQNAPILYYGSRAFWNWQTMEAYSFELAEEFPLCGQLARPCEFNKDWIQRKNASLSQHWIAKRQQQLQQHWEWVENGGYVYNWSRFKASGSPFLNALRGDNLKGNMAVSLGRLDGMSWRGKQYPYLGYAAMDAHGLDAAVADLKWSVFIHSNFEGANFAGANLRGVDFTGCNLQNANFQGADLAGTDFEIADLRGADFTGTNTSFARFPGAKLGGIKRNTPNPIAQPAPIRSLTATVLLLLNDLHVNYLVVETEGFPEHITLIPMRTENNLWGFTEILKGELAQKTKLRLLGTDIRKSIMAAQIGDRQVYGNFTVLIGDYESLREIATQKSLDGVPYLLVPALES